jgi:hypothetical protein
VSSSSMCGGCVCSVGSEQPVSSSVPEPQDPVRAYVEVMLARLEEQVAAGAQVAAVEEGLVVDVRQIGRRGLQKFLDERAAVEARREVTGSDRV